MLRTLTGSSPKRTCNQKQSSSRTSILPIIFERSRKWLGRYAGDCVGLIKAYYWQDGDRIVYRHNNRADVSANGMHNLGDG